ncbi:MAG: hypothetical protein U1F76_32840, partial [Candidatus Competibacteraceae bacterium]
RQEAGRTFSTFYARLKSFFYKDLTAWREGGGERCVLLRCERKVLVYEKGAKPAVTQAPILLECCFEGQFCGSGAL